MLRWEAMYTCFSNDVSQSHLLKRQLARRHLGERVRSPLLTAMAKR